ncbi:hypothetical protein GGS20DRAFT_554141 [Poronia punctata]|nr:hypothetical protein GGS20DRAFT_554141 [Poronia punctata]
MASPRVSPESSPLLPSRPSSPVSLPPSSSPDEKSRLSAGRNSPPAFENLPDEIIQHILQLTDPDSFASLVLLNSKWRRVSQQAHLYAYHLSRCQSYAASHPSVPASWRDDKNLPKLRRLFAREVKRNLFEAYLRPNKTLVKLISNSISSSSAPGGEGMQFSASPRGHHFLAYNSSRIYVLDVRGAQLAVTRELKILRRPVSTCIVDNGSLLAVLSTDMQVDLYDLTQTPPRRKQSLILDNTPRTIALSPCGNILAAAYEGGIEVSAVNPGAHPTERRAVKCDGVDALAFSLDGTQLMGTTTASSTPSTVILTAPYYDPGNQLNDDISALWTTSILFPNTSRDCSHAVLLQESSAMEATWAFTYDKSFETFRAVRIDDLRNGMTYFTGPVPSHASPVPMVPCTLPAASYQGELVSAGFEGKDIWLYGIPEDLEAAPETHHPAEASTVPALHRRSSGLSVRSPSRVREANGDRVPQWQILCDKLRNTFVSGRKIAELSGVSNVKWVSGFGETCLQERMIIAAKGIVPHRAITEEEGIDFVDGGRITILDFDYGVTNGQDVEITIEVGTVEPEVLEEEYRDIDTEVAIVRRRTVAQRRGYQSGAVRATTTINRQAESLLRTTTSEQDLEDPLIPRRMVTGHDTPQTSVSDPLDDVSLDEAQEALDAPYTHASPRSGTTLRRAATAAAVSRRRNPPQPTAGPVEYRRADGRTQHPHESDADNWVPPPPPYSKEDPVVDLPSFLRNASIAGVRGAAQGGTPPSDIPPMPPLPSFIPASRTHSAGNMLPIHSRPQLPRIHTAPRSEQPRSVSDSRVTEPQLRSNGSQDAASPATIGPGTFAQTDELYQGPPNDNIYDASPIGSSSPASYTPSRTQPAAAVTPQGWLPVGETRSFTAEQTPTSPRSLDSLDGIGSGPVGPCDVAFDLQSSESGLSFQNRRSLSEVVDDVPVVGRLLNASTWPRTPQAPSTSTLSGYPRSAPAAKVNHEELLAAALPPALESRPEQQTLAIHNRPSEPGVPRPLSTSMHYSQAGPRDRRDYNQRFNTLPPLRRPSPPEQPLIISTPTGVAGAFDAIHAGSSSSVPVVPGPVLHAPVPRHPRPIPGNPLNRPTAERLETLTSPHTRGESRTDPTRPGASATLSSQLFLRPRTSVHRRASRARRGALKNLQDARERGWTGRKKKANDQEVDHAAGWTDVMSDVAPVHPKAKKCAVM